MRPKANAELVEAVARLVPTLRLALPGHGGWLETFGCAHDGPGCWVSRLKTNGPVGRWVMLTRARNALDTDTAMLGKQSTTTHGMLGVHGQSTRLGKFPSIGAPIRKIRALAGGSSRECRRGHQ